ncbi:hypothetical protein VYU27_002518 [Nannochloropsis oceanica]
MASSGIYFDLPGFELLRPVASTSSSSSHFSASASNEPPMLPSSFSTSTSMSLPTISSVEQAVSQDRRQKQRRLEKDRRFAFSTSTKMTSRDEEEEEEDAGVRGGVLSLSSLRQELESPWNCVKCTYLNAPQNRSCEACGGLNQWRVRLHEKNAAATRAHRQQERQAQEQHQERFKDLMELEEEEEENDDDDDDVVVIGDEGKWNKVSPSSTSPSLISAAAAATAAATAGAPLAVLLRANPVLIHGGGPFRLLPSDLHLHCLGFLHDHFEYVRLRTVSKAWAGMAEHESLWRPLVERDCGELMTRAAAAAAAASAASAAAASAAAATAAEPRTPAAVKCRSSQTPSSSASSTSSSSPSSTLSSSSTKRPGIWSCKACGLLQADRFGLHCEFCSAEREILLPSPSERGRGGEGGEEGGGEEGASSCFRVIKDYSELAEVWRNSNIKAAAAAIRQQQHQQQQDQQHQDEEEEEDEQTLKPSEGSREAAAAAATAATAVMPPPLQPEREKLLLSVERKRRADAIALEASTKIATGEGESHSRWFMAGTSKSNAWEVANKQTGDFYYVYKVQALDRMLGAKWDSLHRGWEWMSNSCRVALRTRLYATREEICQRDDSLIPITSSFQRCVNKLTQRDWPLLWTCMRAELFLQAEGLRRDVVRHMRGREARLEEKGVVGGYRYLLQDLLWCFSVYSAWVFEVSSFFMKMNDQISGERFRTTTICGEGEREGGGENTLYLSEVALVAFRENVLMHFMIRTPVMRAVEGEREGEGMRLAEFFKEGGDDGGGGGGRSGAEEEEDIGKEGGKGGKGGWKRKREGRGMSGAPRASAQQQELVESEEGEVDDQVLATRVRSHYATGTTTTATAAAAGDDDDDDCRRGSHRRRITANLAEELIMLGNMVEELDVLEQGGGKQSEAFRQRLLKPLRATLAELRVDGLGGEGGGTGGEELGLREEEDMEGPEVMMTLNENGDQLSRARDGFRRLRRGQGLCDDRGGRGRKRMRLV